MTKRVVIDPAKPDPKQENREKTELNKALAYARKTGEAVVIPVPYVPSTSGN